MVQNQWFWTRASGWLASWLAGWLAGWLDGWLVGGWWVGGCQGDPHSQRNPSQAISILFYIFVFYLLKILPLLLLLLLLFCMVQNQGFLTRASGWLASWLAIWLAGCLDGWLVDDFFWNITFTFTNIIMILHSPKPMMLDTCLRMAG